jgi:glycosyltransferase involved in cell wall biosynthesis
VIQPALPTRRTRLVVVQRRLTHYRVPLFEALRQALDAAAFELSLVIGDPRADERARQDQGELEWAARARCRYLPGTQLCWLSMAEHLQGADFVVLAQENSQLHNLPLLLAAQPFRVALWGHGADLQAGAATAALGQPLKRALLRRADWAFAYTAHSAGLMRQDMPEARISVLNNAIDKHQLDADLDRARRLARGPLRHELGLGEGAVALFLGSLDGDKRLDLLLDAAQQVHARRPDFELVIAGEGPASDWLAQRCAGLPWVHRVGAVAGESKARWLAASDLMLAAGPLGLGILDAFAAGLPLVISEIGMRSPEVMAYLEPERNGVVAAARPDALADAAIALLADPARHQRLAQAARSASAIHTLEAMVERFVGGAQAWRASPRR